MRAKTLSGLLFCLLFAFNVAKAGSITAEAATNESALTETETESIGRILNPLKDFLILSAEKKEGKDSVKFPPGREIVISDEPVSKELLANFNKLIIIKVEFRQGKKAFQYAGTGFPIGNSLVATALHLILPENDDLIKADFNLNSRMTISLQGEFCTETHYSTVPLFKVGQGSKTLEDILILKADMSALMAEYDKLNASNASAEKLSLLLFIQALKEGIPVDKKPALKGSNFVSGFFSPFNVIRPYIFSDKFVMELITDWVENTGVNRIYGFRGCVEPGFSGGPIFNEKGEVAAMTVGSSFGRNFVFGIPIDDVLEVAKAAAEKEKNDEKKEKKEEEKK